MKLPEEIIFSNGVPYGKVGNATQVREIMNTERMVFESEIVKRYANYDKMKEALGNALANQEQYGYLTEQTQNEITQLLESIR